VLRQWVRKAKGKAHGNGFSETADYWP
jgi:hypothetical protein